MINSKEFGYNKEYMQNVAIVKKLIANCRKSNKTKAMFDGVTMKARGEYVTNMRVLKESRRVRDRSGRKRDCWVLVSYRKKAVNGNTRVDYYITRNDFECIRTLARQLSPAAKTA